MILLPRPKSIREKNQTRKDGPERTISDRSVAHPQGYRLNISSASIEIIASTDAGIFYGKQTLAQIRRQFGNELACVEIEDWPDFAVRGVMLDISRDKVPTMQTLRELIDMLAEWKINQLQLYMEHTFAYAGHEEVWRDASPMTAEEIRELDSYCRERFIELVPNQNSLGHMERWLKHPRYAPMAESIEGAQTPWGYFYKGPFGLCPTDAKCVEFLAGLYDQLLPNFSSPLFNVGCDETFDIGQGRSKAECEQRGVGWVYLDFVKQVQELVIARGRTMMFWGDIILQHPDLIADLPRDAMALNWGYEANHPFDEEARRFAEAGVKFYVCPGTSGWCSIAGRTDNMLANQRAAAKAGMAHGAAGFLNTDWGDYGHLQYLPTSYAPLAFGAAVSWCADTNADRDLVGALDMHVFRDSAKIMGKLAMDLGNVYQAVGKLMKNRSVLFSLLVPSSTREDPMRNLSRENLEAALHAIDSAMASMPHSDSGLIQREFANAGNMLRLACHRGLGADHLNELQAEIEREHRDLWLARNRPGGLVDSLSRLKTTSEKRLGF